MKMTGAPFYHYQCPEWISPPSTCTHTAHALLLSPKSLLFFSLASACSLSFCLAAHNHAFSLTHSHSLTYTNIHKCTRACMHVSLYPWLSMCVCLCVKHLFIYTHTRQRWDGSYCLAVTLVTPQPQEARRKIPKKKLSFVVEGTPHPHEAPRRHCPRHLI